MKGFTLIETIIYTALVGMVLGASVLTMQSLLDARNRNRSALILEEGMRFALGRINYRVSHASGVTFPASGTDTTLTLSMSTPSMNPTTFSLTSGTVMISEGGSAPIPLTGSHLEITLLTFQRLEGSPPAAHVHLDGRLRGATGAAQSTFSLEETISIRR